MFAFAAAVTAAFATLLPFVQPRPVYVIPPTVTFAIAGVVTVPFTSALLYTVTLLVVL